MQEVFDLAGSPSLEIATLLALEDALLSLESVCPRHARIVEMRYFAGLTQEEVALVLGCSVRTVKREWHAARLWLARTMS